MNPSLKILGEIMTMWAACACEMPVACLWHVCGMSVAFGMPVPSGMPVANVLPMPHGYPVA